MKNLVGEWIIFLLAVSVLIGCGSGDGKSGAKSHQITASAGEGGSVTPETLKVKDGASAEFALSPDADYSVDETVGGTCPAGSWSADTYTTGPITADCTVEFGFTFGSTPVTQHTVTASAGTGGSISPASRAVNHGETTNFTVTPATGYNIGSVSGCNGSLSGSTYTTGPITAACTVTSSFVLNLAAPTGVEAEAGDGRITVRWNQVASATGYNLYWGANANINPDSGSSYDDWTPGATNPHAIEGLVNGTTYYLVVTATAQGTESSASVEVSASPAEPVIPVGLNDTGIDWCADGSTNNLGCPVAGYPGQDGDFGRDAQARAGTLYKKGGGAAGFDFTKLDAAGNDLAAGATGWSCVRDNRTGLIWEVKVDDNTHLRHMRHTYTWYNIDSATNGGDAGTANGGTCSGSGCDTQAFVQAVNAAGLCGASDWRLPTVQELLSIVHNGPNSPAIDRDYFPNSPSAWFWSSSPNASDANGAWYVSFSYGYVDENSKSLNFWVRLVRAGQ
jgi:hypothetical protein